MQGAYLTTYDLQLSMAVSTSLTFALLAGFLPVAILALLLISSRRYRRLPPGPPGNVAAEFTKSPMPLLFDRWRKRYGT